ncbi:MAG: NERD domain-containing protein [Clostridia bacterium]|nr:NERD domain-containing protein [Clostridia bacterium]
MSELGYILATAVGTIVLLTVFFALSVHFAEKYKCDKIIESFNAGRDGAIKLMRILIGSNAVLTNLFLPVFDGNKIVNYQYIDNLLITRSGIVVVRIREEAGVITVDDGETWHSCARLKSGGLRDTDFPNPVRNAQDGALVVNRLFERFQIEPPPIETLVVFTAQSTKLSAPVENVYRLESTAKYLRVMRRGNEISKKELEFYRKAILHMNAKKSVAESYNFKMLG